jgi:hypothetical protein
VKGLDDVHSSTEWSMATAVVQDQVGLQQPIQAEPALVLLAQAWVAFRDCGDPACGPTAHVRARAYDGSAAIRVTRVLEAARHLRPGTAPTPAPA